MTDVGRQPGLDRQAHDYKPVTGDFVSPGLYRNDSFIVRIWWERGPGPQAIWRGQVVHARTGQSTYFENLPTLITFIEGWAGGLSQAMDEGENK